MHSRFKTTQILIPGLLLLPFYIAFQFPTLFFSQKPNISTIMTTWVSPTGIEPKLTNHLSTLLLVLLPLSCFLSSSAAWPSGLDICIVAAITSYISPRHPAFLRASPGPIPLFPPLSPPSSSLPFCTLPPLQALHRSLAAPLPKTTPPFACFLSHFFARSLAALAGLQPRHGEARTATRDRREACLPAARDVRAWQARAGVEEGSDWKGELWDMLATKPGGTSPVF